MNYAPKWLKKFYLEVVNDLLLIVVVGLVFLGAGSLTGFKARELLSDFTPLLLGLFGIAITVSALKVNIKEGRDRAREERNQAVRPVLILSGVHVAAYYKFQKKECFITSDETERELGFCIENAGLGVALNVDLFLLVGDGSYYKVSHEIPKISPNEKVYIIIEMAIPSLIFGIVSRCKDVYGNNNYSRHGICDDDIRPESMVVYNRYVDDDDLKELSLLPDFIHLSGNTRDIFHSRQYLKDQGVELPSVNLLSNEYDQSESDM